MIKDDTLERCKAIATATWSDAMDELHLNGVVSGLTKRSGKGRCVGYAMTVRGEVGELGRFTRQEFGLDRMLATAGPGQVLAVELGGAEVSGMGGIGALSASVRGIEGVLIDGGCRDAEDMESIGIFVASRHVTPRTGKLRVKYGHFGEAARLGGVVVRKNDLIVADATGIIVVPQERAAEVLALAEEMHTADRRKEDALRSGQSLAQAVANSKTK